VERSGSGGARNLVRKHIPSRGDIYHLNFAPAAGREQRGPHYGVIVSPREYNAISGMPFVAPITTVGTASRMTGFAISLTGTGLNATGVIQVDQTKPLDLAARGASFANERVPDYILDEILARLRPILADD
jgi:mRNA-degrading endonuclease toxin of MazEF toxin-antitoxin module